LSNKIEKTENIEEKLKYLGLDLDKVPVAIKKFEPLEFRIPKFYDEKQYRQYRYISIKDIQILLSPTNRLDEIGEKYKSKYDKLILLSCAEWYTNLIVNNREMLENYFVLPFMDKDLKDELEDKESFYNVCEKYHLDYPKTYIVTYENKDSISLPFDFPVAVKPSNSTDYQLVDFPGKEKSYKANNYDELNKIIQNILSQPYYCAGFYSWK